MLTLKTLRSSSSTFSLTLWGHCSTLETIKKVPKTVTLKKKSCAFNCATLLALGCGILLRLPSCIAMVLFDGLTDWRTDWSTDWLSGCSVAGYCCCEWPHKPQLNNFCCCNFCAFAFPPFAVAIKNFYLICSSFQVLCSAAIASSSCSAFFIFPVLISYNSLRFSLVAPAQILHGHLLFCWTVAGWCECETKRGGSGDCVTSRL